MFAFCNQRIVLRYYDSLAYRKQVSTLREGFAGLAGLAGFVAFSPEMNYWGYSLNRFIFGTVLPFSPHSVE